MSLRAAMTLRWQLVLLIVAALTVAQIISLLLFADERSLAIRAALGFEAAGRAANVARLIEEAPPDLHASILRAANSPLVRFDLSEKALVQHSDHFHGGLVESRIRTLLDDSYSRDIRVELHQIEGQLMPLANLSREMTEMHMAMMQGELTAIEMNLSIAVSGGRWLNVGTRFERPPIQWPLESMLAFALSASVLLIVVIWFVMTRLTWPLRRLARAADRLGRGEDVPELPVAGPTEVRDLTVSFNRMQERLTRFVNDRTRMLAALGHDLRSPLTAMRVRAEMVDDDETRGSIVTSVKEMQGMVEATLTFARGLTGSEPPERVNLRDYLVGLCQTLPAEIGLQGPEDTELHLRPNAMRRALRNLIENALSYGQAARIDWQKAGGEVVLTLDDDGPGIPEDQLDKVFDPFVRLEESRSLETGGHGLGLSIAQTIIQSHGGDVTLSNRPEGGLRARVRLPSGHAAKTEGETP